MQELSVTSYLEKDNLFALFKAQLKKDFESSGLDAAFTDSLTPEFESLRLALVGQLETIQRHNSGLFPVLLYRIDLGENLVKKYKQENPLLSHLTLLAELMIKRTLQKILIRTNYSLK